MAHSLVLFGTVWSTLTCLILLGFAVFLILLVLVQRGKGGGLSGAFGGMGGQSAFGAKAGDTFTRITVVTATLWILVCIISAKYLGVSTTDRFAAAAPPASTPAVPADEDAGVLGEDLSIGGLDAAEETGTSDAATAGGATTSEQTESGADSEQN